MLGLRSKHSSGVFARSAVVALLALVTGCGGDSGFDLQGSVLWNGAPVPSGNITFSPDKRSGNSGPSAMAIIENGEFRLAKGDVVVGGPYSFYVIGFDGQTQAMGEAVQVDLKLFPDQSGVVDLPDSNAEMTIDVRTADNRGYEVITSIE